MTLPTVQLIHFDTQKLDDIEGPVRNQVEFEALGTVRIQPDSSHWDDFSTAVRSSEADIVVPVLHGTGAAPEITFKPGAEHRAITRVFEAGSVMAPILVPLICDQHPHVEDWRLVAPHSRLVLADGSVHGVATIIKKVVRGQGAEGGIISSGQAEWRLHEPLGRRLSLC